MDLPDENSQKLWSSCHPDGPASRLTRDDVIGDFATLASGVFLGGGVHVGWCAHVGAGALLREHRSIGTGALVGMGAIVTRDIPPHEVWAGVTARRIRKAMRRWSRHYPVPITQQVISHGPSADRPHRQDSQPGPLAVSPSSARCSYVHKAAGQRNCAK